MIHSEGTVVALDAERNEVWIEIPQRASACGNCSSAGACHSGLNGIKGENAARRYRMPNRIGARIGDRVSFGVAESTLLRVSWLSYLLPAILAIVFAAVGQAAGGESAAIAGTVIGLLFGFFWLRRAERLAQQSGGMLSLAQPQATCHVRESV